MCVGPCPSRKRGRVGEEEGRRSEWEAVARGYAILGLLVVGEERLEGPASDLLLGFSWAQGLEWRPGDSTQLRDSGWLVLHGA
jgi:hypothetical protein